jgi:hypothetical protein
VSEIGSSNYSETAASNNATPPNGWPEGMNPSDVNNSARGTKRFWNRANSTRTTDAGGTSTAYTLTYDVAESAYYNGEEFAFYVDKTCGATPTLNINGLGRAAPPQVLGRCLGNPIGRRHRREPASPRRLQQLRPVLRYRRPAAPDGLADLGSATPSGATTVDFSGIPTSINSLECKFSLKPSANGVVIGIRMYGTGGSLDSSTNYYAVINTGAGGAIANVTYSTTFPLCAATIDNTAGGFKGDFGAANIQAAEFTTFNFRSGYQSGGQARTDSGSGTHGVAANITGVRFYIISGGGTFSGRVTLLGSSN